MMAVNDSPVYRITALTHRGVVRTDNEDTILAGRWICNQPLADPTRIDLPLAVPTVVAVVDGMGGHAAGREASFFAACRLGMDAAPPPDDEGTRRRLQQLSDEVFGRAERGPEWTGMGATIAGMVLMPAALIAFNVGDSKIYRELSGYLRQISVDDVPPIPQAGAWTGAQGAPKVSHRVTQALGGSRERLEIAPHTSLLSLSLGVRFLLCTDGLTDMLSLDEMEACLSEDDVETVRRLLGEALAKGGEDNISIIVVRTPLDTAVQVMHDDGDNAGKGERRE